MAQIDKNLHLTDTAEVAKLVDGMEDARQFILTQVVQAELKEDGKRVGNQFDTSAFEPAADGQCVQFYNLSSVIPMKRSKSVRMHNRHYPCC